MKHERTIRNIAVPGVILVPLLVLMVGCFYIPTFEQTDARGRKRDFRPLIDDGTGSVNKPIRANAVDRGKVASLLGDPSFRSANNRVWVYELRTKQGIWVYPQCFYAAYSDQQLHLLTLRFDDGGKLERFNVVTENCPMVGGFNIIGYTDESEAYRWGLRLGIQQINDDSGATRVLGNPPVEFLGRSGSYVPMPTDPADAAPTTNP